MMCLFRSAPGLLMVLFGCYFLPRAALAATEPKQQITVVFRYDDYCNRSPTEAEGQLIDLFRQHKMTCTFGVIPTTPDLESSPVILDADKVTYLNAEKIAFLQPAIKAGVVECAQHGTSHRQWKKGGGTVREFQELDVQTAYQRLMIGRNFLEAHFGPDAVKIFIPPWNTYNQPTLVALEKAGFTIISAAQKGAVDPNSKLRFLPRTIAVEEVTATVKYARTIPNPKPLLVTVLHPHDLITTSDADRPGPMARISQVLDWLAAQPDVRVRSVGQAANDDPSLNVERYRAFVSWPRSRPMRNLPEDRRRVALGVYPTVADVASLWNKPSGVASVERKDRPQLIWPYIALPLTGIGGFGLGWAMPRRRKMARAQA